METTDDFFQAVPSDFTGNHRRSKGLVLISLLYHRDQLISRALGARTQTIDRIIVCFSVYIIDLNACLSSSLQCLV